MIEAESRQMDEIPDDVMRAARECAGNVLLAAGSKLGHYEGYTQTAIVKAAARAILSERDAQRERDAKLIDDGVERQRGKIMRADGVHSKNDMCIHGRYMYEDCEQCCSLAIRSGAH